MPFPWKKDKVSRFSRIVADLQSPKRGNSLVVETGFPTSLVDLFVKNRERLKKPTGKKKKKKKRQQQLQEVEEELVISDPIFVSSSIELVDSPGPIQNLENMESFDVCDLVSQLLPVVEDDEDVEDVDDVDDVKVTDKKCWNEKEKRLLFVVLKMFLVVVLGLSTKKLVVGITMSAFVLIFLEYVGKHVLCFLKPCLNVEIVLELFVERVSSAFLMLKGVRKCDDSRKELIIQEIEQEEDVGGVDSCDLIETLEMKSSLEETQALEFNFDRIVPVEANRGAESRMDLLVCDWRIMEVEEDKSGVLVCEKERSRKSKIRRKIIKKLVPKKLRAIKKAKKSKGQEPDVGSESSSCWGDDEMGIIEVLEDGDKQGFENKGKALLSKLLEEEEEEEEEGIKERRRGKEPDQENSSSSTGWQAETEVVVVDKKGSSDYLILFFVALAGLVGGRSLSLVLTLASCLLIKLIGRFRCVNEPVNRSRASISS